MKTFALFFLFYLFCQGEIVQDLSYGIEAIKSEKLQEGKIQYIQIFGERCSGTNFLTKLIEHNLSAQLSFQYGWKHFPCWYDTPFEEKIRSKMGEKYCSLEGNDNFLFLVIFRDPYDWLRSFFLQPFHVSRRITRTRFSSFLKSRWYSSEDDQAICGPAGIFDRDPSTNGYFKNVLHLRSARIANLLKLKEKVDNVYFLNYETLRENPEAVIDEISSLFTIEKKEDFVPITSYKGKNGKEYVLSHFARG